MINHYETSRWLLHLTKFHLHLFLLLCIKLGFNPLLQFKENEPNIGHSLHNFEFLSDWLLLNFLSEYYFANLFNSQTSAKRFLFNLLNWSLETLRELYIYACWICTSNRTIFEHLISNSLWAQLFSRLSKRTEKFRFSSLRVSHINRLYDYIHAIYTIGRPWEFEPG